jgi:hypothetical protein
MDLFFFLLGCCAAVGVVNKGAKRDGHFKQMQNMAVPADPSDPLLRKWIKVHHNPIATHPASVSEEDFRDPSTAWQKSDGSWMFTVGGKNGTNGVAFQYRSTDLHNWTLQESLLYESPETGMLECVDFFKVGYNNAPPSGEVPDTYVFKASVNDEAHDYYAIGTYDEVAGKFIPTDQKLDIGHGFRLDRGKYYAAKSMYDPVKNRNIMWGWVNESDTMQMDIEKGWSSVLVRSQQFPPAFPLSLPPLIVIEKEQLHLGLKEWVKGWLVIDTSYLRNFLSHHPSSVCYFFCREFRGPLLWTVGQVLTSSSGPLRKLMH